MDREALIAVRKGDLTKLKQRLRRGINIDAQDADGYTLLHHAASNCQYEAAECLLRNDADVLATTNKNNTALHIAVMKTDQVTSSILENTARDKLQKLLDAQTKTTGSTALHVAAKFDFPIRVHQLLMYGAKVDIPNYAGERPIDLASRESHGRSCFELIGANFAFAKRGDATLLDFFKLQSSNMCDFDQFTNCRNIEGHTLMQALVRNGHVQTASELLRLRDEQLMCPIVGSTMFDPRRKREVAALVEGARESREFWSKQKIAMAPLLTSEVSVESSSTKKLAKRAVEMCCAGLKRANEVLLAYRKFEGEQWPRTFDFCMKSLEEVLEVLGFDPEERYEDNRYYEKLPIKWKEDDCAFMMLMEYVIYKSIDYHLRRLTLAQMFHAVKEDDLDRAQGLLDNGVARIHTVDHFSRSLLCYAAENGNKKMVKLLLKSGAKVFQEQLLKPGAKAFLDHAVTSIILATNQRHAKIVKLLLAKADPKQLAQFIDWRPDHGCTALHAAAKLGHLPIMKALLRYGASYDVLDVEGRTPLDVSTIEEVTEFLQLVDSCFRDAKKANAEVIHKIKAMSTDEFMAVAGARNHEGHTLAVVAGKANAKNIVTMILRMVREAKQNEK